jgi:hypothetical protein
MTARIVKAGIVTAGIVTAVLAGTVSVDLVSNSSDEGAAEAAVASQQTSATTDWGARSASPCDGLDASMCALPFPNDYYTVVDASMPTGRRVYFPAGAFPVSANGHTFDPTAWEGNDGFSPGSTILTHVTGLDLAKSHVATISDMGASLSASSPIVLIDARTGARWPTWAELDANDTDPATQLLMIHPARNLNEGDRYLVALRDMKTADGTSIPPSAAFSAVLHSSDATASLAGVPAAYADHLRGVVRELGRDGVGTNGLFLAWDFSVDSARNLTAPALTMRDQTFAAVGRNVGPFTVTSVINDPSGQPDLARVVKGTFDVPSYLTGAPGSPGSLLAEGRDGQPQHRAGRVDQANFECEIPKVASAADPASIGVYGHGLFGSADEVTASAVPQYSNAYDYVFCGTDWVGLSSNTLDLGVSVTNDIDAFPTLIDNLLQALLNAQVLGNLMSSPQGFVTAPAFEDAQHHALIRPSSGLVYYGNSEGGIMGGAFIALSTEAHRAVLGVPGMDYAVLLSRSADFTPFQSLLDQAYPDKAVQQLGFDVMQMLWDRGEAEGYAQQMTGGLPGTPSHQVLLEEAFGDHQVTNVATETEARTIGAGVHQPALAAGRSHEAHPFWDITTFHAPGRGSALFVWDTGVPAEPLSDTAPVQGQDPHDTTPRTFPAFWAQMHTFFTTGQVTNPCGNDPCTGPPPPSGS